MRNRMYASQTRQWTQSRKAAYKKTPHGQAFTKCAAVASGKGQQVAKCISLVKTMTSTLTRLGMPKYKQNAIISDRVLESFVVQRRNLYLKRAARMQEQADYFRRMAGTSRVRKSKGDRDKTQSRFAYSV